MQQSKLALLKFAEYDLGKEAYTFEEFDAVVQERKQTDFFEPYVFDVR